MADLDALFRGAVDTIFDTMSSLTVDVTFTNPSVTGFNFGTGEETVASTDTVTVKGFLLQEISVQKTSLPGYSDRVLVKSADVDPSAYSKLTINGVSYTISGTDVRNNGYVIRIDVAEDT